jgi:hypothetical protein
MVSYDFAISPLALSQLGEGKKFGLLVLQEGLS